MSKGQDKMNYSKRDICLFKVLQTLTVLRKYYNSELSSHVADGLPQPLRNARKLGVNFFETLLPGEHKMGLKKNFIVANFFSCDFKIFT